MAKKLYSMYLEEDLIEPIKNSVQQRDFSKTISKYIELGLKYDNENASALTDFAQLLTVVKRLNEHRKSGTLKLD